MIFKNFLGSIKKCVRSIYFTLLMKVKISFEKLFQTKSLIYLWLASVMAWAF